MEGGGRRGGVMGEKAAPMPPNPHGNPQPHWEGKFPTVNCEKIAERDSGFGALGEIRAASVRNSESGRAFSHRSTKFRAGTGAPLLVFGRGELFPGFVRIWVKQKNLYLFVYFANIPPSPPLPSPPPPLIRLIPPTGPELRGSANGRRAFLPKQRPK